MSYNKRSRNSTILLTTTSIVATASIAYTLYCVYNNYIKPNKKQASILLNKLISNNQSHYESYFTLIETKHHNNSNTDNKAQLILSNAHTCSCSGKVLMAGGYLVLERPNVGLVLTVDARFHSSVAALTTQQALQYLAPRQHNHKHTDTTTIITERFVPIIVYTPQRTGNIPTIYELYINGPSYAESTLSLYQLSASTEHNPFVYTTLLYTLYIITTVCDDYAVHNKLYNGLILYLSGDYQFYSCNPVHNTNDKLDGKTGLGSSAALVSSLVAALYSYFDIMSNNTAHTFTPILPQPINCKLNKPISTDITLTAAQCNELVHHTAQFIHCLAQGKVGSGFDVSAAFYGSQRYIRYSTQCIQSLIDYCSNHIHQQQQNNLHNYISHTTIRFMLVSYLLPNNIQSLKHTTNVLSLIDQQPTCCITCIYTQRYDWNYNIEQLQLPNNLTLILGDVSGGAKTPTMVKNVLAWKNKLNSNNDDITINEWTLLSQYNQQLDQYFRQLYDYSISNNDDYVQTCNVLAKTHVSQYETTHIGNSDIRRLLYRIYDTFSCVRNSLKSMGQQCNADIEPDIQTELCNLTQSLSGVLISGVPGAGGNDAIFAIVLNNNVIHDIDNAWQQFSQQHNCSIQRLQVKQTSSGVQTVIQDKTINI